MPDLVEKLSILLHDKGLTLVTAESCTGGLLAAAITKRPGSSTMFERGYITYSNESKIEELDVEPEIIEKSGAVSLETAQAMAEGALRNSKADISLSITGIAGPDGGSEHKPVGLVYFGYALKDETRGTEKHMFQGNRDDIRSQAVQTALEILIRVMDKKS